jgi:hypothetical protein
MCGGTTIRSVQAGRAREQRNVTFEEHPELIEPWVDDDVDEHAAARHVDTDRQAAREVSDLASLAVADVDVRKVLGLTPGQHRQVNVLLLGRPEPHQIGSSTMASSTINR